MDPVRSRIPDWVSDTTRLGVLPGAGEEVALRVVTYAYEIVTDSKSITKNQSLKEDVGRDIIFVKFKWKLLVNEK